MYSWRRTKNRRARSEKAQRTLWTRNDQEEEIFGRYTKNSLWRPTLLLPAERSIICRIISKSLTRNVRRALGLLIYITPFIYKWDVNYTLGRVSCCRKGVMATRRWAAIGRNSLAYRALPTERPKPQIIQRISTRASTCVIWRGWILYLVPKREKAYWAYYFIV